MSYESRGYYRSRQDGNNYGRSGGGGRYRDDRRGPRRRRSPARDDDVEDIEVRLRGLIIKIGDKISPELQVNLNKMKNILDNDYAKYPDTVQDTLKACITELPAKAPVYGTLLGLLNVSSHDLVSKLMYLINDMLKQTVAEANWIKLKQIMRFYGELVNANVISPTSYCGLINDLLSVLNEPNEYRRRADCMVYIVLSTLPWSAKQLSEQTISNFDDILQRIEDYMNRRPALPSLDILKCYRSGIVDSTQDALAHLWELIKQLRSKEWEFAFIPRLYNWFESEFSSAVQHDIPRVELPEHTDLSEYISPEKPFKIHVDDAGVSLPNVPDHNGLEYFVLNDVISDILRIFEPNRKECGKYLLAVGNSFEPGHFRSTHSNERDRDGDENMDEDAQGWCLADILLEVIMSQMLKLPSSPYPQVYYTCIMAELCRTETSTFPLALGRAVKIMFDRLADMDTECVYRLSCWFAHHLSNFGFQWDWASWDSVLSLEPSHPQVCFIRETIGKLIHLSYYERIKSIIPENLHGLVPPTAPAPSFAYQSAEHPQHEAAREVISTLRAKKSTDDVQALLDRIKEQHSTDAQEQERFMQELFTQCMLFVGSKSFSHVLNVVERYLEVLRYVNSSPEARLRTVQIAAAFWKDNTQFLGIILDKLLNYRVIDPASIITWVFETQQADSAYRFYAWEILQNTMSKVVARVGQVRVKLEDAEKTHKENEAKRAQEESNEMAQAEAQQELDTLRIIENSLNTVCREQKEVFMAAYQRFVQTLQDALAPFPPHERDTQLTWNYRWIFGWYRESMRKYYKESGGFLVTLESVVFTNQVDESITSVFNDVKQLNELTTATV
ncbi:hypothetical protein O0I10_000297 [Lichtheimia ornata]|uniref:MIF4G domain-containing protein n=1 Tax=Lichtheimia ornata TaxID=688661 RepID=A0AAD8DIN7_9FUNG|nr:uncharacterized protein O0I10_000297 [Lichtheimia ornata]KAJ8664019.1 hypothetical protein O0I10_000297 [Lichtheimia ornata]